MSDCIFCKIAAGEIPSNKVYEDETVLAFYDLNPMAKVHVLIIPKDLGLDEGYCVVSNCKEFAGQSVFHLHFHLLGGEQLSMKMC